MKEKKKNIFKYFIKMVFLFFFFLIVQQILSEVLIFGINNERYGSDALFEIIWAGLVLILLLLYKNNYIFSEKRESFKSGFKYIVPEFIMATIFLIISISTIASSSMPINVFSIINLLVYCIFIGIVEEFLCRGWLLNEFLERFSNNKKEIILSIIFSSFIFGIIHFINIDASQNFIQTLVQVLNAGVSGIFLALVYYKTKNIWLVVFAHFYWDFSLMLMEHNQLVECYNASETSTPVVLSNIISGTILVLGYLILCYWLYRKTDLYVKKDKKNKKNYLILCGVVVYFIGIFCPSLFIEDGDNQICPIYKNKKIKSEYNIIISNYSEYSFNRMISGTQYSFTLSENDKNDKIIMKNNNTNKSVDLFDDIYFNYLLVENEDGFTIVIQKASNIVLFVNIKNDEINNSGIFLEKVKNRLIEYHTPEIKNIFVLNEKDNNYNYAAISTNINKQMIFDKNEKLYFIEYE